MQHNRMTFQKPEDMMTTQNNPSNDRTGAFVFVNDAPPALRFERAIQGLRGRFNQYAWGAVTVIEQTDGSWRSVSLRRFDGRAVTDDDVSAVCNALDMPLIRLQHTVDGVVYIATAALS